MIVYGIILLVVLSGFGYYAWFKATQQVQYKETVAEIQKNQSYAGRTDVELLKMAEESNDLVTCGYVRNHNARYSCLNRAWALSDCEWEILVRNGENECLTRQAIEDNRTGPCYRIPDIPARLDCVYKIESGMTYAEYTGYLQKINAQELKQQEQEDLETFERVVSDFMVCFELSPRPECVFMSIKNGRSGELKEYYKKSASSNEWQYLFLIYDVVAAVKRGSSCSDINTDFLSAPGIIDQASSSQTVREDVIKTCEIIKSGDKTKCSGLAEGQGSIVCNAYGKSESDCGGDLICLYSVKLAALV
jgi:hypothetical protein